MFKFHASETHNQHIRALVIDCHVYQYAYVLFKYTPTFLVISCPNRYNIRVMGLTRQFSVPNTTDDILSSICMILNVSSPMVTSKANDIVVWSQLHRLSYSITKSRSSLSCWYFSEPMHNQDGKGLSTTRKVQRVVTVNPVWKK